MNVITLINNKINQMYYKILIRIRVILSINEILDFNNFSITLPPGHLLPFLKKSLPQYDRFLPHLVKNFKNGELIIDVGANCGDTLAAMVDSNPMLSYVCIEPDDKFFTYLEGNVKKIQNSMNEVSIKTYKKLIGNSSLSGYLDGTGGTKHLVVDIVGGIQMSTLDEVLWGCDNSSLSLIKSDVDGYDYDVLDSATVLTKTFAPILYFECQFDNFDQKKNFIKTINRLYNSGYKKWALFDNYGGFLFKTNDINQILDMIEYVHKQNSGICFRTIHYFDILTWQEKSDDIIDMAINQYNKNNNH